MGDRNKFAMNQITTGDQWDFRQAVEGYARHGVRGIGVWRDRLLEFGVNEGAALLDEHGMTVASYCFGGLFADAEGDALAGRVDDFRRMLDEAAAIKAASVVFLAGGLPEGSTDLAGAEERALEGLSQVIPHAKATGMSIGLEPLHPMTCAFRSVLVSVGQAMDWIERLGSKMVLDLRFASQIVKAVVPPDHAVGREGTAWLGFTPQAEHLIDPDSALFFRYFMNFRSCTD